MPRRPSIPRGRRPCLPIRRSRPCLPSPRPLFRRRLARQRMCLRHRRFLPFPPSPRRRRLRPFPCPPFRRCRRPRRRRSRPRRCRRRHPIPSDPIPICCTQREPERPTECGATDRELFARTHVIRPGWDPAWCCLAGNAPSSASLLRDKSKGRRRRIVVWRLRKPAGVSQTKLRSLQRWLPGRRAAREPCRANVVDHVAFAGDRKISTEA